MDSNMKEKNRKKKETSQEPQYKKKPGDIIFSLINGTCFLLFTITCIFPFYYIFINTISDSNLVRRGLINFIPKGITFSNYLALENVKDLWQSFYITIGRTIIGTGLMVLISAFAGYLVTKKEMWHKTFLYRFLVITMYFNSGLIPWYMNMSMLGLTDSFLAYIVPGLAAPFNIILVKTYIESIPGELEESAFMDGASYLTIFRKIIWPLSKPILATIAIFGAVGNWNSFQDSLILNANTPELYTLQHRLYIYLNKGSNLASMMGTSASAEQAANMVQNALNTKTIQYTISMVTIIPILCFYPFMQRYFEGGIMLGAVKG